MDDKIGPGDVISIRMFPGPDNCFKGWENARGIVLTTQSWRAGNVPDGDIYTSHEIMMFISPADDKIQTWDDEFLIKVC